MPSFRPTRRRSVLAQAGVVAPVVALVVTPPRGLLAGSAARRALPGGSVRLGRGGGRATLASSSGPRPLFRPTVAARQPTPAGRVRYVVPWPYQSATPAAWPRRPFRATLAARQPTPSGRVRFLLPWPAAVPVAVVPLDLVEAIVARLKGDATVTGQLAAGALGVWSDQAPFGADLPYLVVTEVSEVAEYSTPGLADTPYIDDAQIQISAFAPSKATTRALGRLVAKSLNDAPLVFQLGYLMKLRRGGRIDTLDEPRGPSGVDCWHSAQTFNALVGRSL